MSRNRIPAVMAPIVLMVAVSLAFTAMGTARSRPRCFGELATQVGTNHADTIVAKPHAVVVARGGNDKITVGTGDSTKHIICGGPGDDQMKGGTGDDMLIGGPGDDVIQGGNGADLVVGDNAGPGGDVSGKTGKDDLNGSGGGDFMVGDNYTVTGNASSASPDDLQASSGNDIVIGDSASLKGNATGGANDRMGGASGDDVVIGDSYAPRGTAQGGGDDDVNGGPGKDLQVGDSYTKTGTASGGGQDKVHASDGGDANATCAPHTCDDVLYGDNFAASCGLKWVSCSATSGGGVDLLNGDQGDDFMNGGPPDDPSLRGKGDKCAGGTGDDTSTRCEYDYPDVEHVIPYP